MVDEEEVNIKVGCITTDFAMQNVLKQIGLNILANNGRLIKVMQIIIKKVSTSTIFKPCVQNLYCEVELKTGV